MNLIKSMLSAFLMYSRIPVPKVEWKEENRRYALCFFPLIGAVVGGILLLWYWLSGILKIDTNLFSAVCVAIPIIVTGGIHMDGFCDVIDAQSSCQTKEKKLAIMSDPHIGAFPLIYLAVYFLVTFGLFGEVKGFETMLIISLGFILSRALSGFAAVTFKSAKSESSLQNFAKPAHKKNTVTALLILILAIGSSMILINIVCGLSVLVVSLLVLLYYRIFSYKNFGGISGDMAGYFLQICEIFILIAVILSSKIMGAI